MDWYYASAGSPVGPISKDALADLFYRSKITGSTLVWNQQFGSVWKAFENVEPDIVAQMTPPPPLPSNVLEHGTDTIVPWLIALSPLLSPLINRVLGDLGVKESGTFTLLVFAILGVALVLVDLAAIKSRNLNPQKRNIGAFCIFMPAYLFRRASVLKQAYWYTVLYLVCWIFSVYFSNPEVFSRNTYWGVGTPNCDSITTSNMARDLGNKAFASRGVEVLNLQGWTQLSYDDASKVRVCNVTMMTTNSQSYPMTLTITPQNNEFLYSLKSQ